MTATFWASIIDEQFFARAMLLAHDHIDLGSPETVALAEAVLKTLRLTELVLLPEQGQGDTGATQLGVSPCPVGHWTLITGNRRRWRKQTSLQLGVGQHRGPSQAADSKAIEVVTDGGSPDLQAGEYLTSRQTDLKFETQYFTNLTHG